MRDLHPFSGRMPHYHIRWSDHLDERRYDTSIEAMTHAEEIARPNEPFNVERYDSNCEICGPRRARN
jgi:alpha-D-ribose 1-methylphosphonate 5-phosphate C-P lyase